MVRLSAVLGLALLAATATAHGNDPFRVLFEAQNAVVALDTNIQVQVDTTTFTKDMQPVKVTVTNTNSNRTQYDYITIYSPPNPDYTTTIPVWYDQLVNLGPSYQATNNYLTSGTVSFVFNLINWRSDFQFVVVRGENAVNPLSDPIILAESPVIKNTIVKAPGQVHLNIDTDQESMVVQWVSASPTQSVKWGKKPGDYTGTAVSKPVVYTRDMMCGGIAKTIGWRDIGNLHQAVIPSSDKAMNPRKRVYYKVGSDADGWSEEFSFLAPPSSNQHLSFLMFNDVGIKLPSLYNNICSVNDTRFCGSKPADFDNETYFAAPDFVNGDSYFINSTKLSDSLPKESQAALALLIGDVSYAQGYASLWDWFGTQFQSSFAQWPLALGIGNHERDWPYTGDVYNNTARDSGGECGVPYRYRYRPLSAAQTNYQQSMDYYSFNMGPVHFIVLDGETSSDHSSAQYKFVSQDLEALNRSKYPWVVVGVHRMMLSYPTTNDGSITSDMVVMRRLQADWFDLFYQKQVDVVVSGHNHAYSRSCPIKPDHTCTTYKNGTSYNNAGAPVFVQAGNGGAGFTNNFDFNYWSTNNIKNYMVFARQFQNGYLRFKASKNRLLMEAVSSDDRSTFDTLTLRKHTMKL
jgi:hypothetical protein